MCSLHAVLVVPLAPQKGVEVKLPEATDGCRHLALKRLPAHLTVGDDIQADGFLESNRLVHRAVFYFFELSSRNVPSGELLLSRKKFGGTQEAPNDIGVGSDHILLDRSSMVP